MPRFLPFVAVYTVSQCPLSPLRRTPKSVHSPTELQVEDLFLELVGGGGLTTDKRPTSSSRLTFPTDYCRGTAARQGGHRGPLPVDSNRGHLGRSEPTQPLCKPPFLPPSPPQGWPPLHSSSQPHSFGQPPSAAQCVSDCAVR